MAQIEVYDPPMCCSSGVCGPEVDPALVQFSADLEWLRQQGTEVRRYNLAQEPFAFTANARVKAVLEANEGEGLPMVFVDGRLVGQGRYPDRATLAREAGLNGQPQAEAPQPDGSQAAAQEAEQPSIFSDAVAELVALGAAIAANCEVCFKFHYSAARKLGVSNEDMLRAVNVALRVKDVPAQSMVELARRHLLPESASATGGCSGPGCC